MLDKQLYLFGNTKGTHEQWAVVLARTAKDAAAMLARLIIANAGRESGTGATITATTVYDGAKAWVTNQWVGHLVTVGGYEFKVTSNTADTLTCAGANMDATATTYVIDASRKYGKGLPASATAGDYATKWVMSALPTGVIDYNSGATVTIADNVLTDSGKTWSANAYIGYAVYVDGVKYLVTANGTTTLTLNGSPPSTANSYWIAFSEEALATELLAMIVPWASATNLVGAGDRPSNQGAGSWAAGAFTAPFAPEGAPVEEENVLFVVAGSK